MRKKILGAGVANREDEWPKDFMVGKVFGTMQVPKGTTTGLAGKREGIREVNVRPHSTLSMHEF